VELRAVRLFAATRALPRTSYGYQPPDGATARGWDCPADGCRTGGGPAPRRWPHRCPECGSSTDPRLDEPWAHEARGPWLRHELRRCPPGARPVWRDALHGWLVRDALRCGDLDGARGAAGEVLRELRGRQPGGDGRLLFPIVTEFLAHDQLDPAADLLIGWVGRAEVRDVEDDDATRTDCRELLAGLLTFLEHPAARHHPATERLVGDARALRDAVRQVLTVDLLHRTRHLDARGFVPAGAPRGVPSGLVAQMEHFGRYSFAPHDSDADPTAIWSEIAAPRYEAAASDPARFCADLAAAVLPTGGWAVYGAQRLVAELLGGDCREPDHLRMQDAALEWLHGSGVGPQHLNGYEQRRWAAVHGSRSW
jgi:hypothetical protein